MPAGPFLIVRDEEGRRETDEFPAREERFDRARQRRDDHAEHEQRIEHEEPVEPAFAVEIVAASECADRP